MKAPDFFLNDNTPVPASFEHTLQRVTDAMAAPEEPPFDFIAALKNELSTHSEDDRMKECVDRYGDPNALGNRLNNFFAGHASSQPALSGHARQTFRLMKATNRHRASFRFDVRCPHYRAALG
jgi:hypothetical protein